MTERTRVRRLPEKARTDVATLHAILDAAFVAHVGIVDDDQPYVVPMACARHEDQLLLHGSTGSRLMRLMAAGAQVCATVTLLDGMVLARSAFNSSMHYRSAMVLGSAQPVPDAAEGLRLLTEHLLPGRWEVLRAPTRKELAATLVVALPLSEWSVKVSDSPPEDDPEDLDEPVWAGVVPLGISQGEAVPAPDLQFELPAPTLRWDSINGGHQEDSMT
ncbi:MAG: pyridoxamine 5'-phosphate oxidase family protein [Candidatus Nanopelagicales bacterium]